MRLLSLGLQALAVSAYIVSPKIWKGRAVIARRDTPQLQCDSKGLMMAPLCDNEVANETAANLGDISSMAHQWTDTDLTAKVEIGDCNCCAITLTQEAAMKLCNKKHITTLISYALLGMTARSIMDEKDCVKTQHIKGSYIWDSKSMGMRFSLDIIGPDSTGLFNLPPCVQATGQTTYSLTERQPKNVTQTGSAPTNSSSQSPPTTDGVHNSTTADSGTPQLGGESSEVLLA